MNIFISWIKKNYLNLIPVILLIIYLAAIWDNNFYIGGDIVLPLNPHNNIYKSIYMWEEENRGLSFMKYMLFVWQIPFLGFSLLGIPAFISIKIFDTSILVISFVFSYLLFQTLFNNTEYNKKKWAFFTAFIFVLNASSISILPGTTYLSSLPLCSYLAIKYLDTKKNLYIILFSICINQAYLAQLPQAKFLFIYLIFFFFILLLYKEIRKLSLKNLLFKLIYLAVYSLLLNAFILIPFIYDSFNSNGVVNLYSANFVTYNANADFGSASLLFITRFFNSNMIKSSTEGKFLGSLAFTLWTFILWIIAFIPLLIVKNKKDKKTIYLLFIGLVLFIFLAKGSNPPFGQLYKYLLFHVFIFKVFRTTASVAIGGTFFFATLVSISIYYISKKIRFIYIIILLIHIIVFYPIYLGYNLISIESKIKIQRGYSIPNEYYQMGTKLDNIPSDIKVLSLPLDELYSYKDWDNYMGISIMDWITKKPFIHSQIAGYNGFTDNLILQRMNSNESCFWTAVNNIGYILNEKDSRINAYSLLFYNFSDKTIFENSYFKLQKVNPSCVLPHIFIASDLFLFQGQNNSIPDLSRFIKNKTDIIVNLESNQTKIKNSNSNIVVEAYPNETENLIDKNVEINKTSIDISNIWPLSFWTYSFVIPETSTYRMFIDGKGFLNTKPEIIQKGDHTVTVSIIKSKNLIDEGSVTNNKTKSIFVEPINEWERDNIYLLSFKYSVEKNSDLTIAVDEMYNSYNGRLKPDKLNYTILSQELNKNSPGIYEYHALLISDIDAQSAKVTISQIKGIATIDSLDVEKVSPAKVFFVHLNDKKVIQPKITSHKINPTKYIVEIKNAKSPYFLAFSESFNPNWKVYVRTCHSTCNLLSDWILPPIPEKRHININGFANGWNIISSDSQGKEDYTIIIEYWPQRLLYIGAAVSILATFCLFASVSLYKNRKKS